MLDLILELADAFERGRLPRLSLPLRYVAAKLTRGTPALAGEPIPVPVAVLTPMLVKLCEALARGGAGASAEHIQQEIEGRRLDAGSLLTCSLRRDHQAIRTAATHRGLAPDLLWLVAELGVSPFVFAIQRSIFEAPPPPDLQAALAQWTRGYCPACGSWPALAEVVAQRPILRCSFCALAWEQPSHVCIYCDAPGDRVTPVATGDGRTDRRLDACLSCSGYLKAIDVAALSPFPLLAIGDLETMDLDMTAMQRGLGRPQLKDFSVRAL